MRDTQVLSDHLQEASPTCTVSLCFMETTHTQNRSSDGKRECKRTGEERGVPTFFVQFNALNIMYTSRG